LTPWQHVKLFFHRLIRGPRKAAREFGDRLFAKSRERSHYEKHYPLLPDGLPPPGKWIEDQNAPRGRRWEGPSQWRTRIGPSTVCWNLGVPAFKAWNVRLPDGSRGDLRDSMAGWRRRAAPPLVWIYGRLVLHDSDIEFVDSDKQHWYTPPPLGAIPNLEAELAGSQDFVAALQDDSFALTAFSQLAHPEWMKVGHREFEEFTGNGSVAGMIAGLRAKGENYLDVENGCLSGQEKTPRAAYSPDQVRRVHAELVKIGWRTHTADEVQSAIRDSMRKRLKDRVTLMRRIKDLELRPEQHCQSWIDKPPYKPLAMPIYEGDDLAWIEPLSVEEQEAMSAETCIRFINLALTARVSEEEYRSLQLLLGWGALLFNVSRSDGENKAR
jgi:hypothetical protein